MSALTVSPRVELERLCPKCKKRLMRLVSKEPWAMNQPIRRWQCEGTGQVVDGQSACDYWEPTYTRRDER